MMEHITVRPAEGRRVRLPQTGEPIPAEGITVEQDMFIFRRIEDGDLVVVEDVPRPAAAKTK